MDEVPLLVPKLEDARALPGLHLPVELVDHAGRSALVGLAWSVDVEEAEIRCGTTRRQRGNVIPVEITVFEDRTFTFILKTPPAAVLLKKAVGLAKGSGVPNKTKVGTVTRAQLAEIATLKMNDLNARDVDHAVRMIEGTARSMGLVVEG